jgi:hypothetical protein
MAGETPPGTQPGLSDEQKDEINKLLGSTVNNMLTARLTSFEKKIAKDFGDIVGTTLSTKLPELLKDFKPTGGEGEGGGGGGKGKKDLELESLRKQFSEIQTQLNEQRQIADAEREKNRTTQLNQTVVERLGKFGQIQGVAAQMALGALTAFGRVGWGQDDDADKIVFKGDDGIVCDLDVGLKQWVKTDEAKIFMSPSGVRGSGSRPGGGDPRLGNGQKLTREQQAMYLQDALERALE